MPGEARKPVAWMLGTAATSVPWYTARTHAPRSGSALRARAHANARIALAAMGAPKSVALPGTVSAGVSMPPCSSKSSSTAHTPASSMSAARRKGACTCASDVTVYTRMLASASVSAHALRESAVHERTRDANRGGNARGNAHIGIGSSRSDSDSDSDLGALTRSTSRTASCCKNGRVRTSMQVDSHAGKPDGLRCGCGCGCGRRSLSMVQVCD